MEVGVKETKVRYVSIVLRSTRDTTISISIEVLFIEDDYLLVARGRFCNLVFFCWLFILLQISRERKNKKRK